MTSLYYETNVAGLKSINAVHIKPNSETEELYIMLLTTAKNENLTGYDQFYMVPNGNIHPTTKYKQYDFYAVRPIVRYGYRTIDPLCSAVLINRWYVPD